MKHRLLPLLFIATVLSARICPASERSQALSARGLVEFHAGHYSAARDLFDQAVLDDPTDVYARYYRASARARLDDYPGAIADLRTVLAARPDLRQAALDLGVALLEEKQYQEAIPWLEHAQAEPTLTSRASSFLGLAQLRLGQLAQARENFQRAERDPEQAVGARYYEGIIDYQQGRLADARERLTSVVQANPDTAVAHEASALLAKLAGGARRPYELYTAVGFQYDSNVILAPTTGGAAAESILKVSQQGDARATIAAGGVVVPFRSSAADLSVGYDFYQSYHKELRAFDLQDHRPSIQITAGGSRVRVGTYARYDYYLLDTQSFLQEATVSPWVTLAEDTRGRTEVYYRMRRRDYKKLPYTVRDSLNHATGVTQYFYLGSPDRYLSAGYQFDHEEPVISDRRVAQGIFTHADARSFAYDGNEVNAGLGWELPAKVAAEVTYAYRHERYAEESAAFIATGERRTDDDHLLIVAARKQLSRYFAIVVAYFADFNTSKDARFDYERHIGSLALEARY